LIPKGLESKVSPFSGLGPVFVQIALFQHQKTAELAALKGSQQPVAGECSAGLLGDHGTIVRQTGIITGKLGRRILVVFSVSCEGNGRGGDCG
jgi:hypothetical protein